MHFPFTLLYETEFKPSYYFAFHVISARLIFVSPRHWRVD